MRPQTRALAQSNRDRRLHSGYVRLLHLTLTVHLKARMQELPPKISSLQLLQLIEVLFRWIRSEIVALMSAKRCMG